MTVSREGLTGAPLSDDLPPGPILLASLEAIDDGLMVTDLQGRSRYCNQRCLEMLDLSKDVLEGTSVDEALAEIRELFVHPERFAEAVRANREDPSSATEHEFELRDGRVIQRFSRPLRIDDELVGRVSTLRDVTERDAYLRELEQQALYDPLTGLPNRNLLFDRLDQADRRAARTEEPFSVLFIDLDQFKAVNTNYGHAVGDRILAEVAARLQDVVREVDTLGRLGGDEFLAVLRDTDVQGARKAARRLLDALHAGRFDVPDGRIGFEASIGIAAAGAEREEPGELIQRADVAMQRAKAGEPHEGPRFAVYEARDACRGRRLQRRQRLREAISNEELRLHWQPIVDLVEEEVVGAEALVRWEHPEEGLLYPGAFVPMAEESGLVREVDRWALRRALAQTRKWLSGNGTSPGDLDFRAALNVSPSFYQSPSFVDQVWEALEDAGVPPDRLDLEITERLSVSKAGGWHRIRGSGVRLAVDDFGAGYSSLRYLRQLEADVLKVDRYFVTELDAGDDRASVLAGSILGLGKELGMGVIAEGVETESQRDHLRKLGYRHAQGYYFGRPMPAGELQKLPGTAAEGASSTLQA